MSEKSDKKQPNIPQHIGIIMDGNRRWAKDQGINVFLGHRKSLENFEDLLRAAKDLGIKCISAWAFSTENWKRSKEEVDFLFSLVKEFHKKFKEKFIEEKVRFIHLGRKDRLYPETLKVLEEMEEETKEFTEFTVAVGIDYGGHDELIRTIKKVQDKGLEITSENIESNLDTVELPRTDLIIRTGGEVRLSGFMSWQCAYAELYFPKIYFPDFGPKELALAVDEYQSRDRRFGGNSKSSKK